MRDFFFFLMEIFKYVQIYLCKFFTLKRTKIVNKEKEK